MSSTNTNVQSSTFLNLFGVFISVVLCSLFIILGGHTLKYIKAFAVKIKIIVNRANDKNVQVKDFNYKPPGSERSEAFHKIEQVFKNEIRKSRSLQIGIIFKNLLAKYDHLVYYPFRDNLSDTYNLLKPKTTFYALLIVCTACIAWMATIFLSAILQSVYSDITTVQLIVFILLTVAIAIISSLLNMFATNRLFRVYLLNMKAAFKVHYGNDFVSAHQNLEEYQPENEIEQEELLKGGSHLTRVGGDQDESRKMENILRNSSVGPSDQASLKTMREETQLNSTRKLLGEEFEKSDKTKLLGSQHEQIVIEEQKEEYFEDPDELVIKQEKAPRKGKALKDIFDMQVGIHGSDDADPNSKYIFIEDTAAIGDIQLLENEAGKGENKSNVTTFIVLFIIISISSIFCCYLNYNFSAVLAEKVFYMFIGGFLGDLLVARPFFIFIMSLVKYCKGGIQGYKKVEHKNQKDIKDMMGKAIKEMFDHRKKTKEIQQKQMSSGDQTHLIPQSKGPQNLSQEDMMNLQDYMTQNAYERDESKHFNNLEDQKEDDVAHAINDKRDEDGDGQGNPIFKLQKAFHPTEFARPQIEEGNKMKDTNLTVNAAFNSTGVPLISRLKQAIQEKDDDKYAQIMEKKQLTNELVDYNLLLLRKIYDAYEEKADKVIKNFRSDKHGVLRKRYMVPILNPNYDYEKLLSEMNKQSLKDEEEENSVHLDGITVCEDYERQLMEAIIQEASDDLVPKNMNRRRIDKFGNPIDEDKEFFRENALLPAKGVIEHTIEENLEEDDEDARKRYLLEQYWKREDEGESFNKEETTERDDLESWRLNQLETVNESLTKNGFESLSDNDKLTVVMNKRQIASIHLRQLRRKKNLTEEERELMKRLERQLLELEFQELQLKEKMGIITEDEKKRYHELDRMFDFEEIDALREIMLKGLITEEQLTRLRFLEKKWGLEHMKNPFEVVEEENHDEENMFSEEEPQFMEEDSRHSGISDDEKFAELPPVHVMNNTSKPQSPTKAALDMEEKMRQELLEKERLDEELRRTQELDQKMREEQERLRLEMEAQRLKQEEEMAALQEKDERIKMQKEDISSRLREEEEQKRLQDEINRLNEEKLEHLRQQRELEEQERLELENQYASQRSKLESEEDEIRKRLEELLEKQRNGTLTEEELEELRRLQNLLDECISQQEELLSARQDDLLRQQQEEELRRQQELELQRQQELLQKQMEDEERLRQQKLIEEQEELLRQQRELDERLRLQQLEQEEALRRQQELDELERKRQQLELDELERQRLEASFNHIDNSAIERGSGSSHQGMSRIGSRNQDRLNQQLLQNLEDDDVMRTSQAKFMDPEYAFGHDDLDPAPGAQDESIYSHKTTTILDEEKVSFMHIEQLPNQDNASDDSFSEQDMVYYNKDDLTNYSKGLGLNKIKAKNLPQQNYFSENDLYEVDEGDISENDSRRSGRSYDHVARRNQYGRGKIQHNQLEFQDQSEYFEGKVKVDAWNLNYRGKKKKLKKKRKVTDNQKRKMNDLQNIYGIDARTLAGLSKGRLPRQLLASGKFKGDGYPDDSRHSDSFRSTQNTFKKPHISTAANSGLRHSVNDAQSNMFSFNGYGTSKRWNEIESTLRGGPKDSRLDPRASHMDQKSTQRFSSGLKKKMTGTQENFAKQQALNARNNLSPSDMLEEESKSGHSGSRSRGDSIASRQFGSGGQKKAVQKKVYAQGKNTGKKTQNKKGANSKGQQNKNRRGSSDRVDSHSESDEAVDDKGAMFQKRNGGWNMNGLSNGFGSMNDNVDDRSESDEGNNQENPDFTGNQFAFKKRVVDDQAANSKLKKGADQVLNQNSSSKIKAGGRVSQGDNISLEDLEAQNFSNKKGRTNKKRTQDTLAQSSQGVSLGGSDDFVFLGNKKKSNNIPQSKATTQDFRLGSPEEREDTEDENLGGDVLFQKRNPRGDYFNNDGNVQNTKGGLQAHKIGASNNNLNKSNSKPPLSGRRKEGRIDNEEEKAEGLYGAPYNISGVIHPGVSENVRQMNAGLGYSDQSDTEGRMRNTFNESNDSNLGMSNKKKGPYRGASNNRLSDGALVGSNSNPNLLTSNSQNFAGQGPSPKRGPGKFGSNPNLDQEDDYIVGPESTHSRLKKKPRDNFRNTSNDNEEERYMLLQRERQIVEEIETERKMEENSKLTKKRKIKRAAQSQNPRDAQTQKFKELQQEKLRKKQREAEAAMFAQGEDDLEKGQAKLKKKKVKKDWVKKEVNYWLDYDSPYAEYLVARFREWSPNPNGARGNSAGSSQKVKGVTKKYQEVSSVYQNDSKQNSRSRERRFGNEASGNTLNVTNHKKNIQKSNSKTRVQDNNNLFVADFEEP